ncbi:MAG: sigma-70 family RNA polymerase sigma factor [Clostridia bacterium]|nr:sigma-70 family RNA polymerase sigma factor [Clostridia bacterium]
MEFSELLQENRSAVERFVRFRIGNPHDAEDVLSDVYTASFVGFGTLSNADAFKPWIIGIARNKCNDYFRRQAKRMEIPLESLEERAVTMGLHGVRTETVVRETLEKLGDRDKQILYLYFFRELPQAEIAKRLGIPLGTVKSRLFQAKKHFKEQYPYQPKGGNPMKTMQHTMPALLPDYRIEPDAREPFAVCWEEMTGWFVVPKPGERLCWAIYDLPSRKRMESYTMTVSGRAAVHGLEGVEIEAVETDTMGETDNRRFVVQLTDTHCRILAESHIEDGVKRFRTFLDGDEFLQNWGFGPDNCGNETHPVQKGLIRKQDRTLTTQRQPFMLDVVGRYAVTIGGKTFDTICLMDTDTYESGVLTEQYLDENGRTILWRRFNRDDWAIEPGKKPWSERLPENERYTVDGLTYVHWYDCITSYLL